MATAVLLAAVVLQSGAPARPNAVDSFLLKGARVVVRPGHILDNTDILIRKGKIEKVARNIAAEGVEVIDCKGLTAYPGLVHAFMRVQIDGVVPSGGGTPAEQMERRDKDPFGIGMNLLTAKPTSELKADEVATFSVLAKAGFGVANVSASGGLLGPAAAAYTVGDGKIDSATVLANTGFVPISFTGGGFGGGGGAYPGSTMGRIAFVRQALYDAQRYGRMASREANAALSGLLSAATGEKFVIFDDLSEVSFFEARRIAKEFGLKPIYGFRNNAGSVRDIIKTEGARVVLRGDVPTKPLIGANLETVSLGGVRSYFNEVQVGAELEKAGIEFSYAPRSTSDAFEGIRTYVQGGLSKNAALASMTTVPAKLLGLEGRVGTLEAGRMGNVLLVQGDLFDSTSQVMATFVSGRRTKFDMPARKKDSELKSDAKLAVMKPAYGVFPAPAESKAAYRLYRNATIWTMGQKGVLQNADLLIQNGKIVHVGRGLSAPTGCEVIDATGKHISPGIWDCHSHTGIDGGVNESTNMITVECRIGDVINHTAIGIYRQLSGGTIGANQLHGSANAIGGQNSTVKWRWGLRPTEFPVAGAPQGVKFALGQNPIREPAGGRGAQAQPDGDHLLTWRPQTRMGVEESIRRALQLGKEYAAEWDAFRSGKTKFEPRRDLQLEGLAEIVAGKRWIHSHGYRSDELLMLLRVAKEYGAKVATLQHVLEGYKIADEMAEMGVGGSTFSDWWGYKLEAYDAIPHNAAIMADRGVSVSINSDSDEHARRLNHEAAKSMRYGSVGAERALSFVTIEPAKQLGIDKWTGSLEAGKDADFVVWTHEPTSIFAVCLETYVDGVKRFDRANDAKQRAERIEELEEAREILGRPAAPRAVNGAELTAGGEPATGKAKFGLGPVMGVPGSARYPRPNTLIQGATVHTMVGEPFVGDVLLGSDGKILSVGSTGSAANATVVYASGLHLYPGLIDPVTTLGVAEIGQVPASDDSAERGDFHPDYRIERTINQDWETLAVARNQGVLTALVRPAGSGIAGRAALIHTEGYTWEDLTLQGGVALAVTAGGGGFGGGYEDDSHNHEEDMAGVQGPREGQGPRTPPLYEGLSKRLQEARDYLDKRSKATAEAPVPSDARYEALAEALDGSLPIMLSANTASEIRAAVAWAEKEGVRIFLYGGTGAGDIADWLAQKGVPLALTAVFNLPDADRPTEYFYNLPAKLAKAGVKFCLTTNNAHDVRRIRDMAAYSAAFGMDKEDAVRSMTLWAAELLGLSERIGAIKPGMEGTVILTDGDILETKTQVLRAWIGGREVDLQTRQTRLNERYNGRPKR